MTSTRDYVWSVYVSDKHLYVSCASFSQDLELKDIEHKGRFWRSFHQLQNVMLSRWRYASIKIERNPKTMIQVPFKLTAILEMTSSGICTILLSQSISAQDLRGVKYIFALARVHIAVQYNIVTVINGAILTRRLRFSLYEIESTNIWIEKNLILVRPSTCNELPLSGTGQNMRKQSWAEQTLTWEWTTETAWYRYRFQHAFDLIHRKWPGFKRRCPLPLNGITLQYGQGTWTPFVIRSVSWSSEFEGEHSVSYKCVQHVHFVLPYYSWFRWKLPEPLFYTFIFLYVLLFILTRAVILRIPHWDH